MVNVAKVLAEKLRKLSRTVASLHLTVSCSTQLFSDKNDRSHSLIFLIANLFCSVPVRTGTAYLQCHTNINKNRKHETWLVNVIRDTITRIQ
jgi:hypothetical protein